MPNFSMPNFPPNFTAGANSTPGLPNFDPSNLPQGVRELAMLQHQQMAQVGCLAFFFRFFMAFLSSIHSQSKIGFFIRNDQIKRQTI